MRIRLRPATETKKARGYRHRAVMRFDPRPKASRRSVLLEGYHDHNRKKPRNKFSAGGNAAGDRLVHRLRSANPASESEPDRKRFAERLLGATSRARRERIVSVAGAGRPHRIE